MHSNRPRFMVQKDNINVVCPLMSLIIPIIFFTFSIVYSFAEVIELDKVMSNAISKKNREFCIFI